MDKNKKISIRELIIGNSNVKPMNTNNDETVHTINKKPRAEKSSTTGAQYKSYYEKLRDPRWQQARLRTMEHDGFSCRSCGDKDSTLNVHHCVPYRKGVDPWDYDPWELITLCESCHNKISANIAICNRIIMSKSRDVSSSEVIASLIFAIDEMDNATIKALISLIELARVIN